MPSVHGGRLGAINRVRSCREGYNHSGSRGCGGRSEVSVEKPEVMKVSIFAWIIVGLIAGFLARAVLPGKEPGPGGILGDLLAGIVGAMVGGWVFRALGIGAVTGINLGSILIAFVGAIIFLLIWRAIAGHGHYGQRPT